MHRGGAARIGVVPIWPTPLHWPPTTDFALALPLQIDVALALVPPGRGEGPRVFDALWRIRGLRQMSSGREFRLLGVGFARREEQ